MLQYVGLLKIQLVPPQPGLITSIFSLFFSVFYSYWFTHLAKLSPKHVSNKWLGVFS